MRDRVAFALLMEPRTGKTKTVLDEFGTLEARGAIDRLLVVAPAGVYRTWEVDAAKHLSDELKRRVKIVRWESGANAATLAMLERFVAGSGPKIFLVNVEALSVASTVKTIQRLAELFAKNGRTIMVIDESTCVKNPRAKRTLYCLRTGPYAKRRRILSGLPTPQSPLDIFAQFAFLDPGILGYGNFKQFQARYAVLKWLPIGPGGRRSRPSPAIRTSTSCAPSSRRMLIGSSCPNATTCRRKCISAARSNSPTSRSRPMPR